MTPFAYQRATESDQAIHLAEKLPAPASLAAALTSST